MTFPEILRSAAVEIRTHKVRSALSGFSISIGIAATLYTLAETSGIRHRVQEHIDITGPGRLEIQKKDGYVSRGLSPGLTSEDAAEIRRRWPELYMVYPLTRRYSARLQFEHFNDKNIMVIATTPDWRKREWVYTLRGRFLTEDDLRAAARVCVIVESGGWVKKPYWARYFPEQAMDVLLKRKDLLGKQVRIEDHIFTVVGIIREPPRDRDPRWHHSYWGQSGTVILPVSTYQHSLIPSWERGATSKVDEIQVDTGDERTAGLAMRRIDALLDIRHRREKDFEIKDYRERIRGILSRVQQYILGILIIGIVAILAGGIGIMNVTLATIFSRIREIGIRRALGATRSDVVLQFISEAMLLGFLGGAAGTPLGLAAARWMAADPDRITMPSPHHIALSLLIAVGTGFLFSVYPAWQASRFDPIEALRYE